MLNLEWKYIIVPLLVSVLIGAIIVTTCTVLETTGIIDIIIITQGMTILTELRVPSHVTNVCLLLLCYTKITEISPG